MVNKFSSLITLLSFFNLNLLAQSCAWAKSLGNATGSTIVNAMDIYQDSDIVIAGGFGCDSLSLGPYTLANAGIDDGFVAVSDQNGSYKWAARLGGTGKDFVTAVAADSNGNIYAAGNFSSLSMTVGSTVLMNQGGTDGFLVRYNAQKNIQWARRIGKQYNDEITGLVADNDGNVYVSGHSINFSQIDTLFVIKMDSNNTVLWQRNGIEIPGAYAFTTSLALDDNQNCYLTGSLYGKAKFDNDTLNSPSIQSGFIVKYDLAGNYINGIIDSSFSSINEITSFSKNIYVTADSMFPCFGWGWPLSSSKNYVARYNGALNKIWQKSVGGKTPCKSLDIGKSISADIQGNVYVAGSFFSHTINFSNDTLKNILNGSYYYKQVFVIKYDSSGNEIWGKAIGGNLIDEGNAILAVSDDHFYLGGCYESDTVQLDQHTLINTAPSYTVYVHMRPPRYTRNSLGFLALYSSDPNGIIKYSNDQAASIYPNPANDFFNIKMDVRADKKSDALIYSADGRLIKTMVINSPDPEIRIETKNLPAGLYWVKIKSNNDIYLFKLIKN